MKKILIGIAGAFLGLYGLVTVIENAYFSATFFGVQAPGWASWVQYLPLWTYDALDFLALVGMSILVLSSRTTKKKKKKNVRKPGRARYE